MPPVYSSRRLASIPAATGPRAYTSAMISFSPLTSPYSAMDAFGNESSAEQKPPMSEKVEQVLHVFSGLHSYLETSPAAQLPSEDSALHASYTRQVSKGTNPASLTNW